MKQTLNYITIIFFSLLIGSCAKMGSITGGPKDEDLPKVTECQPNNYSIHFDDDRIEIFFDEFIVLNDVNSELVISPPLKEKPEIRLKGKSILIELNNELRDSTTYTLNFGQAIADNNEGNKLTNYEFVFSTGEFLDSLSVGGVLLNAFDNEPIKESVNIMLYDDLSDSVVHKEIPVYIGKTDEKGNFRINNLKADSFKIFALKDLNNNFLFDLPNEEIAFLETKLVVDPEFFIQVAEKQKQEDSIKIELALADTLSDLKIKSDSLVVDSIDVLNLNLIKIPDELVVDLFLFQEENTQQFLSDNNRKLRNKIDFSFAMPVSDSFHVVSLIPKNENWYLKEESMNRDSFIYWIKDTATANNDSIYLELNYVILDSMNEKAWKKDSLYFVFREPKKTGKKKSSDIIKEEFLNITGIKNKDLVEYNKKLNLFSDAPLAKIDTSHIEFYQIGEILSLRENYSLKIDSIEFKKMNFIKKWESGMNYRLKIFPQAITDIYGKTTDTLDYEFNVRELEYYGSLILSIDSVNHPLIVQLLDSRDKFVKELIVGEEGTYRFEYLLPAKYKFKFIEDINEDGKWNTGKYSENRQPEKVDFYKGEIEVRSNWEMEIDYEGIGVRK